MPTPDLRDLQLTPLWRQLTGDERRFVREHYDTQDAHLARRVHIILDRARPKAEAAPSSMPLSAPELIIPFGKRDLRAKFLSAVKVHLSGQTFVHDRLRPVNATLELLQGRWRFTGPGERDTWHQEIETTFENWAKAHPNLLRFSDLATS